MVELTGYRVAMLSPALVRAGRVAGHGQGFGEKGNAADLGVPGVEDAPLDVVGPAGVGGEDGLPGSGRVLVSRPQP